jgi:lipopolysaccharide export system protein LptA
MEATIPMCHKYLSFIGLFAVFVTTPLMALPDDKNQPLHVIADKVVVNYAQSITNLEGNVKVTQGSTILLGNKVIVTTDKNQQLVKLIAYGDSVHQASYETIPSPKDSPFHATADIITYISAKKLAIFAGNAHATDGMNQFDGPEFQYFTDEQKVVTEKVANQRSSITIYPGKKH